MKSLVSFPRYERYKESGVDWLGEVPEHWLVVKMKYLYKDVSIKNKPEAELLSVTQDKGVVPRTWVETRMVMPSGNLESFKFISKGDFAISLRSFEGGLEYCHRDGIISPAYTVLKRKKSNLSQGFYKYLFKSKAFISELQNSVVGIREGKNISYDELCYSLLPIPGVDDQKNIATFLDQKTAQIDEAIDIKKKQIELLKERQQVLIQQAVTKGLDPAVRMRDSGVEWIGEVPEHWEVKKLKYILELRSIKVISKNSELQYIGMENIESYTGNLVKTESETEGLASVFFENDILFGKLRPYLSKVHLARFKGICSTELLVYKTRLSHQRFYKYLLISRGFISVVDASTYGSKMPRASSDFIGNLEIVLPPEEERKEIEEYISLSSNKLLETVLHYEAQINKLQEYKSSLINSAVTGKIKITPDMIAAEE